MTNSGMLSIGSDSHAVHELAYIDIAVAHLITADVSFERVVNYWPLPRLKAWLNEKRIGPRESIRGYGGHKVTGGIHKLRSPIPPSSAWSTASS